MRALLIAALFALAVGGSTAGARTLAGDGQLHRFTGSVPADAEFVPGQVVVQFRAGSLAAARGRALAVRGAHAVRTLGRPGLTLVRLRGGASVRAAATSFERSPSVAFAEPNYLYKLSQAIPNDPNFNLLWGLDNAGDHDIDAPEAWDTQTGKPQVIVAVVDSGVAYDHPELNDNVWVNNDPPGGGDEDHNGRIDDTNGWDFVQNDNTPLDYNGHGTHVAGTIGAEGNNNADIAGVNWDVSIMPVRAGNATGGLPGSAILNSINYACANGADVVNGSFGGPGKSSAVGNAIKSQACKNTLFVFAAGNDGHVLNNNTATTNAYPCEYWRPPPHGIGATNVVCVAASNKTDGLAGFSNRGKSAVHLAAPGVDILSSIPQWSPVFSDNLETNFSNWTEGLGSSPQSGASTLPWQWTTEFSESPTHSMTDSPGANYLVNQNYTIRNNAALNLTGRIGCLADYNLRLLMRDFDDEGNVFDWFSIERATGPTGPWTEIAFYFGSTQGSWAAMTDDLTRLDGAGTAYFRFLVHSDSSIRDGGAHVDDVVVKCLQAGGEAYDRFAGTSMATPHVAGVAALLLAEELAMSPAKLKNALLKGVDKKASLTNHVSTGGRLNANRSLAIAMDHTPPNTTITAHPASQTGNDQATFRFVSNEAGSTFQCKHMNGPWQGCSSPKVYKNLNNGLHTFRVRARDKNLNLDPTPAVFTWRVV
jgi:subtilisin family serine protease